MPERTREESEERVLAAVKEWLPRLGVEQTLQIEALDPDASIEGSHFVVSGPNPSPSFVCRRGRPVPGADAGDNGMGT